MNKYKIISLLLITGILVLASCVKKGEAIMEEKVGSYNFTTYTIDTLRLRVTVNDINLGDSLLSPVGSLRSNISFLDSVASLKVYNAETNELFIDTTIILRIGFSTISIVQLSSGQSPFIPPSPNEPPPAAGNYKVRFQYTAPANTSVPFFDSVQCIVQLSSVPVDTIVLSQYELSDFYEAPLGTSFRMKVYNAETLDIIDNTTTTLNSAGFNDFNTAALFGTAPGGVAYNFTLQRIY
jgi:hypothetical protein